MAGGSVKGKGQNHGRAPKYSPKPALMGMGYFRHEHPMLPPGTHGTPIPLKEKHRR